MLNIMKVRLIELMVELSKEGAHWKIKGYNYQKMADWNKGDVLPSINGKPLDVKYTSPPEEPANAGKALDALLKEHDFDNFSWVEVWVQDGNLVLSLDNFPDFDLTVHIEPE